MMDATHAVLGMEGNFVARESVVAVRNVLDVFVSNAEFLRDA